MGSHSSSHADEDDDWTADDAQQEPWASGHNDVFSKYDIGEKLGNGAFGEVRMCTERSTGETCAVKIVDTASEANEAAQAFMTARDEAETMRNLTHPCVIQMFDVFEGERFLFVVMEVVGGGELLEAVRDPDYHITETDMSMVGSQLLQALAYLHGNFIVHRDIKAENILLTEKPKKGSGLKSIKVIDFGLAATIEGDCNSTDDDEKQLDLVCGTPHYCAPEIWTVMSSAPSEWVSDYGSAYGPKVDIWAAGVVLYLALQGRYPFNGTSPPEIAVSACQPDIVPDFQPATDDPGYELSGNCVSFLSILLEKCQDDRPRASDALKDAWLQPKSRTRAATKSLPLSVREAAYQEAKRVEHMPLDPSEEAERGMAIEALLNSARNRWPEPQVRTGSRMRGLRKGAPGSAHKMRQSRGACCL